MFRRAVGIAMYITPDRYDISFAVRKLCSGMSRPTKLSVARLRRLVRYMKGAPDLGVFLRYQNENEAMLVNVYVDGDWSGNVDTCKSTTSGAVRINDHTVET